MDIFQYLIIIILNVGTTGESGNLNTVIPQEKTAGHICLTINNLKGKTGLVRIGIFMNETGYPDQPAFNYSLAKDSLVDGRLRLYVPLDQNGEISISVLDDVNMNGKMDYIFGILPKEGFGFTNNPKITSKKAPPFSVTSFRFTGGEIKATINMVYM